MTIEYGNIPLTMQGDSQYSYGLTLADFDGWEVGSTVYFSNYAIKSFDTTVLIQTQAQGSPWFVQLVNTSGNHIPLLPEHYHRSFTVIDIEFDLFEDEEQPTGEVQFVLQDVDNQNYTWFYQLPSEHRVNMFRLADDSPIEEIVL